MYLQTPVLSHFPLVGIDVVVLFPDVVRRSTRIPYTKLTVFILLHGSLRQQKIIIYHTP